MAIQNKALTDSGAYSAPSLVSQLPPSPAPLVLPPMDPSVQQMIERWRQQMHLSQPAHAEHDLFSEDELSLPATPLSWEHASMGKSARSQTGPVANCAVDGLEIYDDDPWKDPALDFSRGQNGLRGSPAQTWH